MKSEKLPKLKIKFVQQPKTTLGKFDGNLVDWPSWWENFRTVIDENNLSAETKMVYLQSLVEGNAKVAIQGFSLKEEHYEMAKKVLVERYASHKKMVVETLEVHTSRLETKSDAAVAENSEKPIEHENIKSCRKNLSEDIENCHLCEKSSVGKSEKKISSHSDMKVVGKNPCINLQEAENGKLRSLDGDVHRKETDPVTNVEVTENKEEQKTLTCDVSGIEAVRWHSDHQLEETSSTENQLGRSESVRCQVHIKYRINKRENGKEAEV